MNVGKNLLGGIFKRPSLKDLKEKFRWKLGYLPGEDSIKNLDEYFPNPLCIPPKVYPCTRI